LLEKTFVAWFTPISLCTISADIRDICTDGAKSMLGKRRRFIVRVESIVSGIGSSHCMILALVVGEKKMTLYLQNVSVKL
jgi:hypothetical protein